MGSRHGKMRMNVENDRLSSLPNDLIHKVLSYIDIKDAIGTSVLSSRWRFIWPSMPYLNFSTDDFSTLPMFSKFVTNVLSRRNNLTNVYSLKLRFRVKASHVLVKRVLNYAFSHNVQQLNVVCLLEKDIEFPLSIFSSQSLKHLSLMTNKRNKNRISRRIHSDCYFITPDSTWDLPTLTVLDLHSIALPDDNADEGINVISKCVNLKNLTLNQFKTTGPNSTLSIFHPQLSNLTLENSTRSVKAVNVAAPQLKNLTIKSCYLEHFNVSAPDLTSVLYKGCRPLPLSTEGFHSLEKAHIYVSHPNHVDAHQIVSLLQQLHNVKFLELNLEIVEILSSTQDLILHQPSPFVNLKSLKIYPETVWYYHTPKKVAMSIKLKSYLLDSSPRATFTMVLREEIQAQKLMAELRVHLEKKNNKSKIKRARLERGKTHVESHEPKKLKTGKNVAQITSGWVSLSVQVEKARVIISKMKAIEELVTKLPASKRAMIQPCFSSLCAEANIAISKITECMKIQCNENHSPSSVSFHEDATTLEPSF